MADALAKGEEQFKKELDSGKTPEEALQGVTVLGSGGGHWGDNSAAKKAVKTIASLKLNHLPIKDDLDAGCDCPCFKAKEWRIKTERQEIDNLTGQAKTIGPNLDKLAEDLTATFWNTALPVLQGSIKAIAGAFSGDAGKAIEGAKDLVDYYNKVSEESARVFMLLRATNALSEMKRVAMLGVIYFDQQVKAPTCHPLNPDDKPPFPGSEATPPANPQKGADQPH